MEAKIVLTCRNMGQRIELALSNYAPRISSVDFSKCVAVYEDGWYEIGFSCSDYGPDSIKSIQVAVNGKDVGEVSISQKIDGNIDGVVVFQTQNGNQLFLLQYDLAIISFTIYFEGENTVDLFSDYLLCVSKSQEDSDNIEKMIQELISFDDTQIGEWLFSSPSKETANGLHEGHWYHRAYKSLSSYIQLLEEIAFCYKNNFSYFRLMGKHTIKHSSILSSYEKVKSISTSSFQWLMQNANELSEVSVSTGIQYQGKNYLPYQLKTETREKSWDIYENRVIVCFIYTVLNNAKSIQYEYEHEILNEERIVKKINGSFPKEYRASIITIKTLQISFCKILLQKLSNITEELKKLYKQYRDLFDLESKTLVALPRKTKSFQEIMPYSKAFEVILKWFQFGEYSMEKDKLILQVKTLDKLFEYYCLIKLLELFTSNGYDKQNIDNPAFKFDYTTADDFYQNEKDVANTYLLKKGDTSVTLYYQPVISSIRFENGISLYKSVKSNHPYYTPDFVLKFSRDDGNEEYAVLDAKFSSRQNIQKHSLPEVMRKYSTDMSSAKDHNAPRMVWILQGRVNSIENSIWRYHNSPLAVQYRPHTSYGIVSLNTMVEVKTRFWNELQANIPWLI